MKRHDSDRPRAHVAWTLRRYLGEGYACSGLGEDLGARAYAMKLSELSYQAPQTGVRWNDTTVTAPELTSRGFCGPMLWGRPGSVFGTVPMPTDAEHQGTIEAGQPFGRDTDPSSPGFYGPLRGGYPMRVGTVLAYRGT